MVGSMRRTTITRSATLQMLTPNSAVANINWFLQVVFCLLYVLPCIPLAKQFKKVYINTTMACAIESGTYTSEYMYRRGIEYITTRLSLMMVMLCHYPFMLSRRPMNEDHSWLKFKKTSCLALRIYSHPNNGNKTLWSWQNVSKMSS